MMKIKKKMSLKRNLNKVFACLLSFAILMVACDDIFEENISDEEVFLLTPADGVVIEDDSTVTLSWDFLVGARDYQIQLVSPSFENATNLILDSITTENQIEVMLPTGQYEWAVSGFNNGFATDFFQRSFTLNVGREENRFEDQSVNAIAPMGDVPAGNVLFLWDEVNEVDQYQVQVITPSFSDPLSILFDTLIETGNVSLPLNNGKYEWRIRAINEGGDQTDFTISAFSLLDDNDGNSSQSIQLLSPDQDARVNSIQTTFSWEELDEVSFYVFRLDGPIDRSINTDATSVSLALDSNDGEYEWSVTAVTELNQSIRSDINRFVFTSGAPASPTLQAPMDDSTTSLPLTFSWERTIDTVSGDSLYIYNENMQVLKGFPIFVDGENIAIDDLEDGNYFWDVNTLDNDRRMSPLSTRRSFVIE